MISCKLTFDLFAYMSRLEFDSQGQLAVVFVTACDTLTENKLLELQERSALSNAHNNLGIALKNAGR